LICVTKRKCWRKVRQPRAGIKLTELVRVSIERSLDEIEQIIHSRAAALVCQRCGNGGNDLTAGNGKGVGTRRIVHRA
jgi:hypothetical protein